MFEQLHKIPRIYLLILLAAGIIIPVTIWAWTRQPDPYGYGSYGYGDLIEFKDDVESNADVRSSDLKKLTFQGPNGKEVSLEQYQGQKNVVLVVTRGYVGSANSEGNRTGSFCTYCSTQASRLIANYHDFQDRNAEVLLVFPVARVDDAKQVDVFATKVQGQSTAKAKEIPFPMVVDLELAAVNQLGIRDDLSKPATYILDKDGNVRFAYVGQTLSDRPSIKVMLEQLDAINRS